MFQRVLFRARLGLILFSFLAPLGLAQEVDEEQLIPVAERLEAYRDARASGSDVSVARADLALGLDQLGEALGRHPLSDPGLLSRLWWLSEGYADERVKDGKVVTETLHAGSFATKGLEIAVRAPRDYDAEAGSYPLILTIPDHDETPAEHLRSRWTDRDLMDRVVLVCPAMPSDREEWNRVMVDGRPGGLCHVLMALRYASEHYAIDFDQVFVCGRGKGVPAAVATGNYSPQRFAGVFGIAGDVGSLGPENFQNLPTLFSGGAQEAKAFAAAVEAAGWQNCELRATSGEAELGQWLQATERDPYPSQVSLKIGDPFPTRVNWLRVAPIASDAHASAEVDRAENRITVEGEGVAFVTLYLNDALVDLGQPLTVLCNGVENQVRIERSLATWLDLALEGTNDGGNAFVAEVVFDMTGEGAPIALAAPVEPDREFLDRLAAAEDAAGLWELYEWCLGSQREDRARSVLPKILRVAPDHAEARAAAGHVQRSGTWFRSAAALARFERSQDADSARSKGHVEHEGVWMHPEDRSQAGKGQVKDLETGLWWSSADRRRLADGWARQDFDWIAPEEAGHADDGLWLVDGEWVDLASANRRHSRIDNPWRLPDAEVIVHATVDRDVAVRAREHMSRALNDLRKVFGAEPRLPLEVFVLRDEEQYDRFAFGDPDGRRSAAHVGRLHVLHSAVFAESRFTPTDGKLEWSGMGACYWDAYVPYGDLYGVHSARLAVGLSYVDALDSSSKAIRKAARKGPDDEFWDAWRTEKKMPDWLRFGGAVYAERYFEDLTTATDGDRWWARRWSLDNIASKGGLRPLDEVFACELNPDDREDGSKLLNECGLVVAFIVDGGVAAVAEAHAEVQAALVKGRLSAKQVQALADAVRAHESELQAFATAE